jgi:nucleoside-diphosphate-sugar epimerase
MKNVLITGANSYVGTMVKNWLEHHPDQYSVDTVSLRNDSWKNKDFTDYDVVLHVAGVAHMKETKRNADLYYRVNRDLAYETAHKAKIDGVKQFIFVSSMSVYGIDNGFISRKTQPSPRTNYGKSKLQAEELISPLSDEWFKVAIMRPPMIYGKGCKGNYARLAKFVVRLPVFPKIENKRSVIYIDNLCEFVRLLISDCKSGMFFPQNEEYGCTYEMVKLIAGFHGKKIWMTKQFNPLLRMLRLSAMNKMFGDLVYEKENDCRYNLYDFETSIRMTET